MYDIKMAATFCEFASSTFTELFKKICVSSGELLGPLVKVLDKVESYVKTIDQAGRDLTSGVKPEVVMAIQDLKVMFHEVGGKARLYVIACKNMAAYVCESGVLEAIKDDLEERGSAEELKYFLDDMGEYLCGCKSSLEQFNTIQRQFKGDLRRHSDQWEREAKKGEAEERKNLYAIRGSGIAAVTLGGGGVAVVALPSAIVCPPVALALSAVMFTGTALSVGLAGAFAVERGISEEKKRVFVEAAKRVVEFYEELADVEIKIIKMEANVKAARVYIGGDAVSDHERIRRGLTEMVAANSSGGRLRMKSIQTDLDQLRKEMKKTLTDAHKYLDL